MARKPVVSRTVVITEVDVLAMDVNTAEPENRHYILTGTYKDDIKLMKILRKNYETDEFKIIHIVNKKFSKKLFGMDENEFLAQAKELDPVTRRPIT